MTLTVAIIGGGIGGLTLAHGLRRSGVTVRVYERDRTKTDRLQGYRVHLSPKGCQGLRSCLEPEAYERFLAGTGASNTTLGFYDDRLRKLLVLDSGLSGDGEDEYRSVNRTALREVLISGLGESLELGRRFTRYENLDTGRVRLHFESGEPAEADLVVAADGAGSKVRQQYLPQAPRVDTGAFVVSGKVPLTPATMALLPEQAVSGPCMVFGREGRMGFFAAHRVGSHVAADADAETDLLWDDRADYIMWNIVSTWRDDAQRRRLSALSRRELLDHALTQTADWSDKVSELLRASDLGTVMLYPFSRATMLDDWAPGNITLLGDAIHCMPPTAGQGANTAIRDAALLREAIVAIAAGERDLVSAIGDYERSMRGYAYPIVAEAMRNLTGSTNPGRFAHAMTKAGFRMIGRIGPVRRRMAAAMTTDR